MELEVIKMNEKHIRYIGGALVFLIVGNIFMYSKILSFDSRIDNLSNRVEDLHMNISDISDNLHGTVSEALKTEASMINYFNYEHRDMKDGKVSLNLTVSPKEMLDASQYYLAYKLEGKDQIVEAKIKSPIEISADIDVPIDKELDISFIAENSDGRKIEKLDYIAPLADQLLAPFNYELGNGYTYTPATNTLELGKTDFTLYYSPLDYDQDPEGATISDVNLYVQINDDIVDTFPMEKSDDSFSMNEGYKYTFGKYPLNLKAGDKLDIYAIANHSKGYKVKVMFETFALDENGDQDYGIGNWDDEKSIVK